MQARCRHPGSFLFAKVHSVQGNHYSCATLLELPMTELVYLQTEPLGPRGTIAVS